MTQREQNAFQHVSVEYCGDDRRHWSRHSSDEGLFSNSGNLADKRITSWSECLTHCTDNFCDRSGEGRRWLDQRSVAAVVYDTHDFASLE